MRRDGRVLSAFQGLSETDAAELLNAVDAFDGAPDSGVAPRESTALSHFVDLRAAQPGLRERFGTALGTTLHAARGARIALVAAHTEGHVRVEPVWLSSYVRHVGMCVSHLLLRSVDRERQQQRKRLLQRVMQAQERGAQPGRARAS